MDHEWITSGSLVDQSWIIVGSFLAVTDTTAIFGFDRKKTLVDKGPVTKIETGPPNYIVIKLLAKKIHC